MISVVVVLCYLVVGLVAGRVAFARMMSDVPHRYRRDAGLRCVDRNCRLGDCRCRVGAYNEALIAGVVVTGLWPVAATILCVITVLRGPWWLLTRETRSEKRRRLTREREVDERETERLASAHGLPVPDMIET